MAFLSQSQLEAIGFASIGKNIKISDRAVFYNTKKISVGDNVRIDDFCIISAGDGIIIGNYVHIACYCSLIGKGKIRVSDFAGISAKSSIYSSNDDYSGSYLTNPMVPSEFTNVQHGPVTLEKHTIIGAGSIILPNVIVGFGTAIGAMSLITKSCEPRSIYAGNPARRIKSRNDGFVDLEKRLVDNG